MFKNKLIKTISLLVVALLIMAKAQADPTQPVVVNYNCGFADGLLISVMMADACGSDQSKWLKKGDVWQPQEAEGCDVNVVGALNECKNVPPGGSVNIVSDYGHFLGHSYVKGCKCTY